METESAIDKLRRIVDSLGWEDESVLTDLPSVAAILEYWDLRELYGVESLEDIGEVIAEGADAKPLRKFVRRYKLSWEVRS